jgi:hypothetical protein
MTISITVIDSVSAANASRNAEPTGMPEASKGRSVSAYPNMNARTTASAIDGTSCQPSCEAVASPMTSPIPQPVRQWTVAVHASRFGDGAVA